MTSSVPSTDAFIESFPTLPSKIVGQPDYASLTLLRNELKQNAASVPSNRGGGIHGYLGTVMSAAMYDTIAPGTPFTIPAYPGPQPIMVQGDTAAVIGATIRMHQENLREWREYTNIGNSLKKQLIEAIEPVYLRSQRDRHVGFANRTLRELFSTLFTAYGMLTPIKLIENQQSMNKPWDPNAPFETLIEQIEDGMELADAGGQAFTDAQILTLAYTLVYTTGLYFDECKTWITKPPEDKTWDRFKTFFLVAQSDLRQQQLTTTGRQGYSAYISENEEKENATAEALQNLASATASDREAFAQLIVTNSDLANQLKSAMTEITNMKNLFIKNTPTHSRHSPNKNPDGYCWTHGHRVAEGHTSTSCKWPRPGHQLTATKQNQQGGSSAGKSG
jgi:hypothetical protein